MICEVIVGERQRADTGDSRLRVGGADEKGDDAVRTRIAKRRTAILLHGIGMILMKGSDRF